MVTRTDIAVIGAGLAGAACARALARAGFRVTVFEAQGAPASGASGNPIAILHPLVWASLRVHWDNPAALRNSIATQATWCIGRPMAPGFGRRSL